MLSSFDAGTDPGDSGDGSARWLPDSACYRVDVRAFRDSDGDGCGDLDGVREQLDYLCWLGIDIIWLSGFLASPLGGRGNGRDVDPILGTIESFDKLVEETHARGIRVMLVTPVDTAEFDTADATSELVRALEFWMDRGVDGFRLGITPGMTHPAHKEVGELAELLRPAVDRHPRRVLGALVDEHSPGCPGMDRFDMATDIRFCGIPFDADAIRCTVDGILGSLSATRARASWALAGWDQLRPVTRYGGGATGPARARALALVQMALPGIVLVDNGDELGLPELGLFDRVRNAPDRGVIPWNSTNAALGFTQAVHLCPPAPAAWSALTVEQQRNDPRSTLTLFRRALRLRREHPAGEEIEWFGAPLGCLAFRRAGTDLVCALNTTRRAVPLPAGSVLLASSPLLGGELPADTAVWLRESQ